MATYGHFGSTVGLEAQLEVHQPPVHEFSGEYAGPKFKPKVAPFRGVHLIISSSCLRILLSRSFILLHQLHC